MNIHLAYGKTGLGLELKDTWNVKVTLDRLVEQYGKRARICVLPEGPQTISYIAQPTA